MGVGPSAEVIEAFANEVAADLVVVGTSGATGIRRAALGSVADGVLRRFACDILRCHRPARRRPAAG